MPRIKAVTDANGTKFYPTTITKAIYDTDNSQKLDVTLANLSGKADGNHTHSLTLATDDGTNQVTLAHNTKYKLTAGGQSVVFTTPSDSGSLSIKVGSSGSAINPSDGVITLPEYETGAQVNPSVATPSTSGTGGTDGLLSAQDKEKLDGIASGATANVGTVTGVTVGSGGTNYTPTNGVVTIPAYPTTLPASDVSSWAKAESKPPYTLDEVNDGTTRKIPTKVSDLTNDSGFTTNTGDVSSVSVNNTSYTPSNGVVTLPDYPTTLPASDVSSWAKANVKPAYTLDEVSDGLLRQLPTKVSDLSNDSGFLTSHQSLSGYATETWVSDKFDDVLGINASGISALTTALSDNDKTTGILKAIADKVDKESGKRLMTDAEGTKLSGIETGAQVHIAPTTAEVKSALGTGSGTSKYLREDGTWVTPPDTNTWRPLGTGADDACAGNDSRLSDARPASDVYNWAKQSSKPSYTLDEVSDGSTRKLANYLPLSGGTITGNLIIGGSDIPEVESNLSNYASSHSIKFYRNGFLIPFQMNDPKDDVNDGGFFRVRGTNESNTICEIGTWDDSGAGETIQFNYYPTTSTVDPTYSVSVPKATGTLALTSQLPTAVSQLSNDSGYITSSGSCNYATTAGSAPASDVYSWAKAASKPSYDYSEIGYTVNATSSAGGTLSLAGTTPLHVVTLTGNVSALSLSANPAEGHSCHVIFTAASDYTVAIAHDSTNRVCPGAEDISLDVPAGGYVEIDFLTANSKVFVRGV